MEIGSIIRLSEDTQNHEIQVRSVDVDNDSFHGWCTVCNCPIDEPISKAILVRQVKEWDV